VGGLLGWIFDLRVFDGQPGIVDGETAGAADSFLPGRRRHFRGLRMVEAQG
jgi:hypothetical protein